MLLLKHCINSHFASVIAQWLTCLFILGSEAQSVLAFWITSKSKGGTWALGKADFFCSPCSKELS